MWPFIIVFSGEKENPRVYHCATEFLTVKSEAYSLHKDYQKYEMSVEIIQSLLIIL